jgi:hypothetical protein
MDNPACAFWETAHFTKIAPDSQSKFTPAGSEERFHVKELGAVSGSRCGPPARHARRSQADNCENDLKNLRKTMKPPMNADHCCPN